MVIDADRPENWNCQEGEGLNKDLTHTECVDEEVVLDLIYVSRMKLVLQRKGEPSRNPTRSPPSDRPGQFHGVFLVCSAFWKWIQQIRS